MLEVARTLVADPETRLAAPLVFLFNGGEETILLAAHGFMATSKWAASLGAFINLESTGPGGPAYVFQHTGKLCFKKLKVHIPLLSASMSCQSTGLVISCIWCEAAVLDGFARGVIGAVDDCRVYA